MSKCNYFIFYIDSIEHILFLKCTLGTPNSKIQSHQRHFIENKNDKIFVFIKLIELTNSMDFRISSFFILGYLMHHASQVTMNFLHEIYFNACFHSF